MSIEDLVVNIKKILKIENGKVSNGALILIAKAAEGSVRDSLSLLDRALVSQKGEDKEIDETFVRRMLGIADRSKILNLLDFIFQGKQKKSIELLREMVNEGIEPTNFLNDLLEMIYFIQQKKTIGNLDSDLSISEAEQDIINLISKDISMTTLIVFWQLILKVLEELQIVASPILSLEMLIVRLVRIKDLPSYENVLETIKKNNLSQLEEGNNATVDLDNDRKNFLKHEKETIKSAKDQIKNTTQVKPVLSSLKPKTKSKDIILEKISSIEELILLTSRKKEIKLKYDLERVNLIKFSEGKINISFNENLDKNFVRSLAEKLFEWTGNRWLITLEKKEGQKTFLESQNIKKKKILEQEKEKEIYKKFKNIFSDGELLEVKKSD